MANGKQTSAQPQAAPRPADLPPGDHYASLDPALLSGEYSWLWGQLSAAGLKAPEALRAARIAVQNMARYEIVSNATNVPWFFIAAIHYREASQSWAGCLHNGDPWSKKTIHVPAGRGPWTSWEDAAVDALQWEGYAGLHSWQIGDVFRRLELYNGPGYRIGGAKNFTCHKQGNREGTFNGIFHGSMQDTTPPNASPYVYNGTPFYVKGMSIEDHSFYPDAVDDNVGVMMFLKAIETVLAKPLFGISEHAFSAIELSGDDQTPIFEKLRYLAKQAGVPEDAIARMVEFQQVHQPGRFPRFWACCNFSLPSRDPQFTVFDRIGGTAVSYFCAHGVGSEDKNRDGMAVRFSNTPGSNESSLGIYRCAETYQGKHGVSCRIDGLDPTNSNARERTVVIHSAPYVSEAVAEANGRVGCSDGCFALSQEDAPSVIQALHGGSLLIAIA